MTVPTPYSYRQYAGNGTAKDFAVPFPYLERAQVRVYINLVIETGVYTTLLAEGTGYSWTSNTQIQAVTAPATGQVLTVRRETPNGSQVVVWQDGSNLIAADLNTSDLQNLYVVQEWIDYASNSNSVSQEAIAQALAAVATANAALQRSGGTMTGPIVLSGNPTAALQAAPKQYIDAADAVLQGQLDSKWNKSSETIDSTEAWLSQDDKVSTNKAADTQFSTLVQPLTPAGTSWPVGKTWLQNDANKALSIWNGSAWLGVASGGAFTTQPTVIYVDAAAGNDADNGHRIINPKKTIKNAVASAAAGDTIKVAPGVYQEVLPIDITVANLSIVGEAQRSCFIHPTVATQEQIMFRCNSGTYIDGFTFAGLKASGGRGGNSVDNDAVYGLPTSQGWVAGFLPGCVIRKSPYINNSTNFADSGINNAAFDPNNYSGTGGDTTSGPAGGGIIVDGSLPDVTSPLRSFVVNEFTQICLDGPGLLVCNNGYAQAVSFFGLFCHYHAKALSGGQINMEVGTTDFGRYGLIADGKSPTPIFTATSNGSATAAAVTFAINIPTAGGTWFGDANRPATNMLAEVTVSGTTYLYPILNSGVNGAGWNVTISRPNPSNRAQNLGLDVTVPSGTQWRFYLRSMVSTASHTMEYAGSGTNYTALPENGGVPIEANESVNRNGGKVWLTSTDQNGRFKVGDTFAVDQQTGYVTIDPQSVATNVVSDTSPELGGDLDVLARNIYSSVGNVVINDPLEVLGGSAATPSLTFTGDLNTGIYRIGADQLGIATNGVLRFSLSTTGATVAFPVDVPLGTAAAPSFAFTGDLNTGLFSSGADVVDVTTGGTAKVRFDNTTAPLKEISSSVYYPVVTQTDIGTDPNQVPINGFLGTMAFQDSAGVNIDQAAINTATISSATISSATISSATISGGTVTLSTASVNLGSAAAPAINFTGDTNTGIYSPGADQFAIATGGVGRVQVAANGSVSSVVPGGTTLYPQFGCRAWVNFDGVGSTIRGSGNVSSVTKTATGEYTINFTTAMPDANYATTGLGHMIVGETSTGRFLAQYGDPLTTSTKVVACNGINATRYDPPFCNVAIFR